MSKRAAPGGVNPPWLFISFGIVLLWLGFSLYFFSDASEDVRGIPNPLYGIFSGILGVGLIVLGIYYLLKRRSQ